LFVSHRYIWQYTDSREPPSSIYHLLEALKWLIKIKIPPILIFLLYIVVQGLSWLWLYGSWLCNLSTLNVPDERYSRNMQCALI
jgi:hypothetical protein